jgi:hypothetical protein
MRWNFVHGMANLCDGSVAYALLAILLVKSPCDLQLHFTALDRVEGDIGKHISNDDMILYA